MKWIDFPFQFGSIFCLFYCAGKQLLALSQSGLFPSIFKKLVPGSDAPYVCYTFTAIVAIGMNMLFLYDPTYLGEIKAVTTILSVTINFSCLLAYMVFRRKFSSMAKSFVNPFGDFGAIWGIIVFAIAVVGNLFYNPTVNKMFLVGIGAYWVTCAIFFFVYLVRHQKFSEEEKKVMFKAYLINANQKKRKNMLRNNKVGSLTTRSKSDNDLSSRDRRNSQTSIGISASIAGKHAPPAEIRKAEEV
eukprot:CAMPEP_0173146492 /NCGR_PEP_ID=MMETSP1105-20130129/8528_1 /TAXON_ID=2985 /ORGANISM="Ochromonas sp., Strain BG-1" /LENGTH=244 /DNA_ID=CAMNT_0014060709 /DNA_START=1 /DNA_END=735 /DNA_ORIENTATION=-